MIQFIYFTSMVHHYHGNAVGRLQILFVFVVAVVVVVVGIFLVIALCSKQNSRQGDSSCFV